LFDGCGQWNAITANHPSGNVKPSRADINLTREICAAGRLLDIKVVDHLIISPAGMSSMREAGLL